jgi:nucleosome binding factor SPN SPT16 subunit
MTKNFDLVLVYKDYQTFKRISAIPMEYLDTIKSWLDATNILFSEGPISLNWPNILAHIREDFDGFVEDGSWVFLRDNVTEEDNTHGGRDGHGSEEESDSEYNESEDAEEDGSESDFSGEDGESEESDAESSDVQPNESDEEEGLEWDELERRAIESDRKQLEMARNKAREISTN